MLLLTLSLLLWPAAGPSGQDQLPSSSQQLSSHAWGYVAAWAQAAGTYRGQAGDASRVASEPAMVKPGQGELFDSAVFEEFPKLLFPIGLNPNCKLIVT